MRPSPSLPFAMLSLLIPQVLLQPPGDFQSTSPRSGTPHPPGRRGGPWVLWEPPEAHTCHSSGASCQSLMTTMMTWTCKIREPLRQPLSTQEPLSPAFPTSTAEPNFFLSPPPSSSAVPRPQVLQTLHLHPRTPSGRPHPNSNLSIPSSPNNESLLPQLSK